ncbi:sorting nexin-19 isoform X2 [Cyclopterus lumpus]|uniref:sorting nexin-19 isoform X2 n=1 Tax=Cyclopterus lumpus TaxID=8103 RepID=UPI0014862DA9|nr:sorting nexin-19 isoform X2 [Cyclopterus lumpus]
MRPTVRSHDRCGVAPACLNSPSVPEGVEPDGRLRGAMAEALGQRSLLGFGVVLVWLVLFHLLVNIWLLCVFTSLLVVLGGWLGSQAVLESNSVVHLERFITLEQVLPSAEEERRLDREIHNTVRKVIRDFVASWFSTVSSETGFETEVQEAMISMAMELKRRSRRLDRKELTQRVLDLFGCHLQDYIRAKELASEQPERPAARWGGDGERLWRAYSAVTAPHLATTGVGARVDYTRALVDLLLHVLVPPPHLESRTGRFVVGELITCNVLLPVVAKLSDPDWLNVLVIGILGRSRRPQEPVATEPPPSLLRTQPSPPSSPPPPAEPELAPLQETQAPQRESEAPPLREMLSDAETPELFAYDVIDAEEADCPQSNAEEEEPALPFLRHYVRGSKLNPFYQENDSDLDSPLGDYKRGSVDSLVMVGQEDNNGVDPEDGFPSPADGSCPKVLVNSEPVGHSVNGNLQDPEREGSPSVSTARELLLGVEQNELTVVGPLQGSSPLQTFSFEPLISPDGPVIIQNLRISGTITAKEHRGTGSHPYTLYTIKYETMGCETPGSTQLVSEEAEVALPGGEDPSAVQQVAYHMVNRRYSEFLNLQTRLEEKTELRRLIKGVKGPKKVFPEMPFGNMDSDKIEARKGLLEIFLKLLCAIPEIANSVEMQEFLALNTDARIAFVKKPFIVSRIDKIVVNAIVDTLKTAFPRSEPQSPTEDNEPEVDGGKFSCEKKSRSRLKFSSKSIPFMNGSDIRPPVSFSWEQTSTVFNGMSLGDLKAFIAEQEQLSVRAESERVDSPGTGEFGGLPDDGSRRKNTREPASETALAEVALNILCLLMEEQWSWLCTENIQKTIRLLFGTFINRWLDVSVANLTSSAYWVAYLQVIQESVWPGGALPTAPRLERSRQQKDDTRRQALSCLMRLLPDLISDLLGSDKYKLCWQTALGSLQDPHINRHLVFCIFDLLLEFLVPEIPEEDFQRSLLRSLSKNPEKQLA